MSSLRVASTCLLLALTATVPASAQQTPRRKVGLVLEGGGALGFAHIGVIQWLEDHHIPVDYVAGTSMGGLVGGLYAAGKSPAEISQFVRSIDWSATMRGEAPLRDLAFRRKEDRLAFPNRMLIGLRGGIGLTDGMNSGQEIGLILDRATAGYAEMASFDALPIPFRCVAVEMLSGQQAVFDKGDLAVALRSTMSIPGAFSPSVDGDKIYTDGGALNNLPVDVMKSMGADVIIAVILTTAPVQRKDMKSITGVISRTLSIMISANEARNMQAADILIPVDLAGYTAGDYLKNSDIEAKGLTAAGAKQTILSMLSMPEPAYQDYLAARQARIRKPPTTPEFIDVQGVSRRELATSLEKTFESQRGKPINDSELTDALAQAAGLGRFESVGYRFVTRNGQDGLRIRAVEKPYAPPFLTLGLNIDGADPNDVRFTLDTRLTFLDLGGYRREWRTDFSMGGRYGVRTEYYRPFTAASNWFIAPRASITLEPFRLYSESTQLATYNLTQRSVGADIGYLFNRFAEVRVGQEVRWLGVHRKIGDPLLPNLDIRGVVSRFLFRYEGADDPVVPRRGLRVGLEAELNSNLPGSFQSYTVGRARFQYFHPITKSGSAFIGADSGTVFGANSPYFPPFILGSPGTFGAYGQNEIIARDMFYGTVGWTQELYRLPPLIGDRIFAVGFFQQGAARGLLGTSHPKTGTGAIIIKTAIGPIFAGGSFGDQSRRRWYFGLGRIF